MTETRRQKVAAAVKAIRAFHALGRSLGPREAHRDAYGRGTIDAAAERSGVNPDTVRKARQFADPVAGYTPAEVADLCRLLKAVQPGQGDGRPVFGRTHLIRLLSVPRARRAALQDAAVRGAWSTAELEAEIAARYGSRRDGGRKRRPPRDALGLLAQAERLCEGWRRWHSLVAGPPGAAGGRGTPTLGDLPDAVAARVRAADAALAGLHRAVTDELTARRPGRGVRHRFRDAGDEPRRCVDRGNRGRPESCVGAANTHSSYPTVGERWRVM